MIGLTLGHLKEHRGNRMFSEIRIDSRKQKILTKIFVTELCPLKNLC